MPKSKNRRKNGKVKKYKPKNNKISKGKLEEIIKFIKQNPEFKGSLGNEILEIKAEESPVSIESNGGENSKFISQETNIINDSYINKEDENSPKE